jgi:UDP-glucose 4-epimerase
MGVEPPRLPLARIAITGCAGVYGRALLRELRRASPATRVLGIDRRRDVPQQHPADETWHGDILDPALADVLHAFRPDSVVHLAYAVQPLRSRSATRDVNVEGTRRVLAAAAAAGAVRVLVASSATVYGAWPDNPPTCDEAAVIRPRSEFAYASDKGRVERLVADFAAAHPHMAVSLTRPAIICGPGLKNFLSDLFLTVPFITLPDGRDTPLQFVHEDDVAGATLAILMRSARGPFNVAPPDAMTQRQIARAMKIAAVPLPFVVLAAVGHLWWTLRLPWVATPPGLAHYLRHPWLVNCERLMRECGFACARSSREAFASLLPQDAGDRSHTV